MPVNLHIIRSSLSKADVAERAIPDASSIYVHVPFCQTKCAYCDFYSLPRQSEDTMAQYVDAVLREASWWSSATHTPITTVFFGGGTPTLLPRSLMQKLIRSLKDCFIIARAVEWTTEATPATLDGDYCVMLHSEGVNR